MQKLKEIIAYFLKEKYEHEKSYNILIVENEGEWIAFPDRLLTRKEAKEWITANKKYHAKMYIIYIS